MADQRRDRRGQFSSIKTKNVLKHNKAFINHHAYDKPNLEDVNSTVTVSSTTSYGWKQGRRVVEFLALLEGLKYCKACRLGPIPLCMDNVVGELKKGLGGYLYVKCVNLDCGHVNLIPYGTLVKGTKQKTSCFAVNNKLGTAMIDRIGGPNKVNNFLATLNIPTINNTKLKKMESRAGLSIEEVANRSMNMAAKDAFTREMENIVHEESQQAEKSMDILEPDLGIAVLPSSSPSIRTIIETCNRAPPDCEWTYDEDNETTDCKRGPHIPRRKFRSASMITAQQKLSSARSRLAFKFLSVTPTGMSCSIDTAWQKRGFDSLTSHTFFMSQAKYGKAIVKQRTCGTCRWWKRNRPGQKVCSHRCVHNHVGSARSMESASGEAGIMEMQTEGTPIEYIEGDGDNTLIARLKANQNIRMKKRFDKNHVVKNIGKHLYNIKNVKLSKTVIIHLQKCVKFKYIFAKNQGNPNGMAENLQAVVPHHFGDHSLCQERFCGAIKNSEDGKYVHKGLPYKAPLKDPTGKLREALDSMFGPVINNATQYSDLGSSQQCEHANREVTLRKQGSNTTCSEISSLRQF